MIADLLNGLLSVAVAFSFLMALCIVLGKTAGYFSAYRDRQ